jgi:Protein of unknown function (DUF3431)
VYLQYIVSHYDKLPETMVFIHAHRWARTANLCASDHRGNMYEPARLGFRLYTEGLCMLLCRHSWHMQDVVKIIKRLRWGQIGYANLRHRGYTVRSPHTGAEDCGVPCLIVEVAGRHVTLQAAVCVTGLGVRRFLRQDVSLRLGGLHPDAAGSLDTSVCGPAPGVHKRMAALLNRILALDTLLLHPRLLPSRSDAPASRRTQQASCPSTRRSTGSSFSRTSSARCRSCCTPRCLTVIQPSLRRHHPGCITAADAQRTITTGHRKQKLSLPHSCTQCCAEFVVHRDRVLAHPKVPSPGCRLWTSHVAVDHAQ